MSLSWSSIYFTIYLSCNWHVSFLQKDTLPPSSAIDLVNKEENSSANMETDNTIAASPKTGKSVKAGEKAPPEAIKSWKENGFSRFLQIFLS